MNTENNRTKKPIIRLKKLVLENFKSVDNGEITFYLDKDDYSIHDSQSNIIGIYGQNGSGKTSVIQAMSVIKDLMSGRGVSNKALSYITKGAEYTYLECHFEFYYEDGKKKNIVYSFKLRPMKDDDNEQGDELFQYESLEEKKNKSEVMVYDEAIHASGDFYGKSMQKQPIITVGQDGEFPFGPARKVKYFLSTNTLKAMLPLAVNKAIAAKQGLSFIFMNNTMRIFQLNGGNSEFFQIIKELKIYARNKLFVIDDRNSSARLLKFPIYTPNGNIGINTRRPTVIGAKRKEYFYNTLTAINTVLPSIVPGLTISAEENNTYYPDMVVESEDDCIELFSVRGERKINLLDESEGVLKLISMLSLIIMAFNDDSCAVAIDEFDAGIYEHLLGELLITFDLYGKGQLVFTSHNLRPLEVLNKESLIFTTSNAANRYIRLKGVGRSNNLRDLYLREILDCRQDEEIYSSVKRFRLVAAFQKAGGKNGTR